MELNPHQKVKILEMKLGGREGAASYKELFDYINELTILAYDSGYEDCDKKGFDKYYKSGYTEGYNKGHEFAGN